MHVLSPCCEEPHWSCGDCRSRVDYMSQAGGGPAPLAYLCSVLPLQRSCQALVAVTAVAEFPPHRNGQLSPSPLSLPLLPDTALSSDGLDITITSGLTKRRQVLGFFAVFWFISSTFFWIGRAPSARRGAGGEGGFSASKKMRCSAQPRSFAGFVGVFLLFWGLRRGFGARIRTCPLPCACSGELLDCSRMKRGQIPETFPEWTSQLWVQLKSLLLLSWRTFEYTWKLIITCLSCRCTGVDILFQPVYYMGSLHRFPSAQMGWATFLL